MVDFETSVAGADIAAGATTGMADTAGAAIGVGAGATVTGLVCAWAKAPKVVTAAAASRDFIDIFSLR
jgi:hypothetical protein